MYALNSIHALFAFLNLYSLVGSNFATILFFFGGDCDGDADGLCDFGGLIVFFFVLFGVDFFGDLTDFDEEDDDFFFFFFLLELDDDVFLRLRGGGVVSKAFVFEGSDARRFRDDGAGN